MYASTVRWNGSSRTTTFVSGGDWLRLLQVGTPDTTYLQYLFIGGGVTNRT